MSREGGVEVVVGEVATRQAKLGHDVICINRTSNHVSGSKYNTKKVKIWKGVNIDYALTIDKKGLAAVTASFFASIKSALSNCDIVHIHAEGPGFFSFIPKIFGKKVVCHIHGLDWKRDKWKKSFASKFIKSGEKNIVKYADQIIVLNNDTKKYFKKNYNVKTTIVENGVNKPVLVKPNIIESKYNLDKESYILYLSRLVPEKKCDMLINAYNAISTDKKLVIAGSSSDTIDYYDYLKTISRGNPNIIFTGFVQGKELEELYSNAYIYVLPSSIEGMPLSLLEAMSYGNCCLVSDIAECKEVIADKGVYFNCGDEDDLISKLSDLLCDKEKVLKFKQESCDYICSKYSWDKTTNDILKVYQEIV